MRHTVAARVLRDPTSSPPGWADRLDEAVDRRFGQMVRVRRHLHATRSPAGRRCGRRSICRRRWRPRDWSRGRWPAAGGGSGWTRPGARDADGPATTNERLVALRADIDALRIQDAKEVEYRSRGARRDARLRPRRPRGRRAGGGLGAGGRGRRAALPWPVRWRAIFQPAEETNQGALEMIAAGALAGVGAILSLHVDPSRPAGTVGVRPGAFTAACDEMHVELTGRGGHAARPHESLDPIAAAAQFVTSVYLFVPRGIDTHDPVVVTFGQISGGDNANVIPDKVILRGTVRTLGDSVRRRALDHIRRLARGLAEGSGIDVAVQFLGGPPSVRNDPALTDLVRGGGRRGAGAGQRPAHRPAEHGRRGLRQLPGPRAGEHVPAGVRAAGRGGGGAGGGARRR